MCEPIDQKKPRLFYYDDTLSCWAPVPGNELEGIIGVEQLHPGEETELRIMRSDMTDSEFESLPEKD